MIGLNLFNLLPVEPLDGGVALRSVLAKLMGAHARFGLLAIGVLIVAADSISNRSSCSSSAAFRSWPTSSRA